MRWIAALLVIVAAGVGVWLVVRDQPADKAAPVVGAACRSAQALADAGAEKEARAAYVKLLGQQPDEECAKSGLKALEEPEGSWLKRAADWVTAAAPVVLVLALALAFLFFLFLMLGYVRPIGRGLRHVPGVRYILRPRFAVADLDDRALAKDITIGPAMSGRVRERLQRFREETQDEERAGYRLDTSRSEQTLVDTVLDDTGLRSAFDKLGEASDNTKLLAAMVNMLAMALPIRRYKLTGIIEPSSINVPMATIALERNGRLLGTVAVDLPPLKEPPPGAAYLRLCDATAVWAQYHIANDLRDKDPNPKEAESYAEVRHGLDLTLADDLDEALAVFNRAIELDPTNWAAHANRVALLDQQSNPAVEAEIIDAIGLVETVEAGKW